MIYKEFLEKIGGLVKKQIFIEWLKYLVVGGFCTLIDFVFLYILTEFTSFHYVISSVISFSISVVLNYFLSTTCIFKVHKIEKRQNEFFYYLVISIVGLMLNSGLIWLLTEAVSVTFMLSKVLATPIVLLWNFLARKYLLHTK